MDVYLAEDLIQIVRTRAILNDKNSEGTTDGDLLDHLNIEAMKLYGKVAASHEEFFVVTERFLLVSGKQRYRIPHRALYSKVRDLMGYDSSQNYYSIERLARENIDQIVTNQSLRRPLAFYVEGQYLVLWPSLPSVDGYIDMSYCFRPGWLVLSTDARKVIALGPGAGQLTLTSAVPSTWTTSVKYDIHSCLSGSEPKNWSMTATDVTSDKITFATTDLDGSIIGRNPVEVGDWVCLEEQAALPGMPREFHPVLAQIVVCRILQAKDPDAFQVAIADLNSMLEDLREFIGQRVDGRAEQVSVRSFFGS